MPSSASSVKSWVYKIYFSLAAIECMLVLLLLLRGVLATNASTIQLILIVFFAFLVFFFAGITVKSFFDNLWLENATLWLDRRLERGDRILILSIVLIVVSLLMMLMLSLWQAPLIREYTWYSRVFRQWLHFYEALLIVFERLYPFLVWFAAFLLQSLLVLVLVFWDQFRRPGFWNWQVVSKTILVLGMLVLSLIQWIVLAMQISVKALIPGWYWDVYRRPISARHLFFLVMVALAIGLATYVLRHPNKVILSLVVLTGWGCVALFGFGVIQGQGAEYVRLKYAGTNHRSYALIATGESPNPLEAVREYEKRYGLKMFPSTKPPGVVLFYVVLEKVVNSIQPNQSAEGRFYTFTRWITFVFPVISFFIIWLLYLLVHPLMRQADSLLPSILYVFVPNVILIPLFLDQVLYPLLFLTGFFLLWRVVNKRSVWLAVLAGLYIYTAIFFTFSLLTLIPLFFVLLVLDYWLHHKDRKILNSVWLVVGLGSGILVLFVLFRVFLNYDFFHRYDIAMRVVRNFDFVLRTGQKATVDLSAVTVQPSLAQIFRAAFLNNIELAAAVGFPIFLLFLWRVVRTILALLRRRASQLDFALGAMCLTYIALNLYGQVQGEVSRLWIFWVPMIVTFAGVELATQFRRRVLVVNFVVLLQLITTLLIFQFQDYLV